MPSPTGTVRVEGLSALVRAFGRVDKDMKRGLQRELSDIAKIVATGTQEKLSALSPPASSKTVSGVRPRVRGATAYVEQRLGKTTGKRGDWGATQMKRAFLPSLEENADRVEERVDAMIDGVIARAGF